MMKKWSDTTGFTILGMLIAAAIIGIVVWLCLKERPEVPTGSSESMIKEAGIDTRTYKSTLDSTKELIKDIETQAPDLDKLMDQR